MIGDIGELDLEECLPISLLILLLLWLLFLEMVVVIVLGLHDEAIWTAENGLSLAKNLLSAVRIHHGQHRMQLITIVISTTTTTMLQLQLQLLQSGTTGIGGMA